MENLEEILQALDEFQKMRPSEIPRELEDYLCWVAKTGDPVYQWSLIKTLFREKLIRVMTDFYESCPRLDLTPCPNVEHFNYDTMKSNLLERLESFANAPFTVQRICELLTAPRKEYNRVDKFMRAIEKNILVVSTREPGPIARRSENGDSMVNGSIEAETETEIAQSPQDVEMEYWEKDCSSTVTINVHSVDNEPQMLPLTVVASNGTEQKTESSNRSDTNISGFVSTNTEFVNVANLTSENQIQDSTSSGTRNASTVVAENSGIVGDVPDAIMNEDTSSQPGLDLENEDCEGSESSKKLQTTFQAKDFTLNDSKSKLYLDTDKFNEKADVKVTETDTNSGTDNTSTKEASNSDSKTEDKQSPVVEDMLKVERDKEKEKIISDNIENVAAADECNKETLVLGNAYLNASCTNNTETLNVASAQMYESDKNTLGECQNTVILPVGDTIPGVEEATMPVSSDVCVNVIRLSEKTKSTVVSIEEPKPTLEESISNIKESTQEVNTTECTDVTIVETAEDKNRVTRSLVPDPIPIVEEPKDPEPTDDSEKVATSIEILEESDAPTSNETSQSVVDDKSICGEKHDLVGLQGKEGDVSVKVTDNELCVTENIFQNSECGSIELMEVDGEELSSVYPQSKRTEQEPMELTES